ncbi:hypothetical protein GCM10009547_30130 [Sporichthya brevicatena]|uniref:Fibronectin type-III domain-containing protein n=1 Tax=Sporichthya brevicatena TaxID=171442 RepID=A0ABN1GZV2_9ACTN
MRTFRDLSGGISFALVAVVGAPAAVVALPSAAVARTAAVAPVMNLQARAYVDEVVLYWQQDFWNPGHTAVVRGLPGTLPPSSPTDGFGVAVGSGASTATVHGLEANTPYSFAVFAQDLAGEYAAPATITVSSLRVTLSSAAQVVLEQPVTLSGRVTDAITGAPAAGLRVHFFAVPLTTGELIPMPQTGTQSDGRYSIQLWPRESAQFVAVVEGDWQHLAGSAVSRTVKVLSQVVLKPLGRMQPLGALVWFKATVFPRSTKALALQQRIGKKWRTVAKVKPKRGVAQFKIKPTKRGKHFFRAKGGGVPGVAAGTSKTRTITIR